MKGDEGCVFVKTSCRSAKDTTCAYPISTLLTVKVYSSMFKKYYQESMAKRQDTSLNSKVIGLLEAGLNALKVTCMIHNTKE